MIIYYLRDNYLDRVHSSPQFAHSVRELVRTIYNGFTDDKGEFLPSKTYQHLEVIILGAINDSNGYIDTRFIGDTFSAEFEEHPFIFASIDDDSSIKVLGAEVSKVLYFYKEITSFN